MQRRSDDVASRMAQSSICCSNAGSNSACRWSPSRCVPPRSLLIPPAAASLLVVAALLLMQLLIQQRERFLLAEVDRTGCDRTADHAPAGCC